MPLTSPTATSSVAAGPVRRTESLLGIGLMLGGMFLFAATDAMSKLLVETLPALQVAWARQIGLVICILPLLALRGGSVLRTARPGLQILRGLLTVGSSLLFIIAVRFVPLADAIAVSFVAPLVITVLGALFLGEAVGVRRWTAVAIGFAGAIIVLRPGLGIVDPAALLVLGAAAMFAGRQVVTRLLSDSESTMTMMTYTALAGAVVITVPLPFVWQTPATTQEVLLLVGIALVASGGEYLVILSLRAAESVVVAPAQYSLLIWSTIYGYAIFLDLPDLWTIVGALIIVASSAYTFYREHKVHRAERAGRRAAEAAAPIGRGPAADQS